MLDLQDFFAMLKGDDCERAFHELFGCLDGGCGFACVALVVGHSLRGGSPASMVIRTR